MAETWVLASRNKGKALELEKWLRDAHIHVKTLDDIGFVENIEETGITFEENAELKAKAVWQFLKLEGGDKAAYGVLSDDSGLEVDSLQGAPGVYSARFGEKEAIRKAISHDIANNQKLLDVLKTKSNRDGRYVCVLCLIEGNQKNFSPQFFKGVCEGSISESECGENGFGYDPLFIPKGYSKTFGALPVKVKKECSHRSRALKKLLKAFS